MVLEESRYVCRYVLTFFGDWLVHASDVMVAMDENMIKNVFGIFGYWVNKCNPQHTSTINKCSPMGPGFYPVPIYIYYHIDILDGGELSWSFICLWLHNHLHYQNGAKFRKKTTEMN